MNKGITTKNSKGQYHAYQELYWSDNTIYHRGMRNNGDYIGYLEWHTYRKIGKNNTSFFIR